MKLTKKDIQEIEKVWFNKTAIKYRLSKLERMGYTITSCGKSWNNWKEPRNYSGVYRYSGDEFSCYCRSCSTTAGSGRFASWYYWSWKITKNQKIEFVN